MKKNQHIFKYKENKQLIQYIMNMFLTKCRQALTIDDVFSDNTC